MKKTYIFIVILFVSTYSCKAQLNEFTETEFFNIKFNDVSLSQIFDTKGDINQMKSLFGNNLESQSNTTGPSLGKDFWNDYIYFNFEDESDTGNQYSLTNIQIESSLISLIVKGITVRLGDDKSVFGNDVVINTNNGDNSIVFIDKLTGSASLAFKIDKTTNKIIEIVFNAFD